MPEVKVSVDIHDLVTAKSIISYYEGNFKLAPEEGGYLLPDGQGPFLGDLLFDDVKQMGLDISWIKGSGGLPIALKSSAFDVKVTHRGRKKADRFMTEMPFFKEGSVINENERQKINTLVDMASLSERYKYQLESQLKSVFDGYCALIIGAAASREYMKMELLSTGNITVAGDGTAYEYDYKLDDWQKITLTGEAKWDAPLTAQPITDIVNWKKDLEKKGKTASSAILNSTTMELIKASKQVKDAMVVINQVQGALPVTDKRVKELIFSETGIKLMIYDKMAKTDANTEKAFWPDNVFTMIPNGKLGKMYYGTTPEESDLMTSKRANADVKIIDTGVAVTVTYETDPVWSVAKVSQVCLPSGENLDGIFIANVA